MSINSIQELGRVEARPLLKTIKAIKKHLPKNTDKQRIIRLQFKPDALTVIADD